MPVKTGREKVTEAKKMAVKPDRSTAMICNVSFSVKRKN